MKFGKFVGLVVALGLGAVAQAQFSVYGTYTATRVSGMPCLDLAGVCSGPTSNALGTVTPTGYGNSSHVNTTGGWGGVSYDFRTYGPMRLGLDFRAGEGHSDKSGTSYAGGGDQTGSQHFLAGVKGSFRTPIKVLKPYAQISAGWARSNAAEIAATSEATTTFTPTPPRQYDHFIEYVGIIGIDIKLFPILDLRPVELGIGNMNMIGTGGANAASSLGVKQISAGLVFHLPE